MDQFEIWEYITLLKAEFPIYDFLNKMGESGWELVCLEPLVVFKRHK